VKWCLNEALVVEEREEEAEAEAKPEDVDIAMQSLIDKHGMQKVLDTAARLSQKDQQ
jgi:benzoyl-CoA reductase subunit BamC